jgi:putative membrane protein insertion efficiency factor
MLTNLMIAFVRLYQRLLSPLLGNVCRFEPSCSRYAVACLENHGALRGGLLSVRRLCKCHPFHPGGFDPPPPARRQLAGQRGSSDGRDGSHDHRAALPTPSLPAPSP